MERLDEAGRQVDVGMPIPAPCFEHADAGARIFAEAVGEYAACGARANDYIIERFHIIGSFLFGHAESDGASKQGKSQKPHTELHLAELKNSP